MSSPTTSPTRQQLEELDALLQRMLSLPVNSAETETASVPPPPPPPVASPAPPIAGYSFTSPAAARPAAPRPVALRPAAPTRPAPSLPRRSVEVAPGDHSWNVPLPATGGVSVYGQWPGGIDPLSATTRPILPPPATAAPSVSPPGALRVATIPSPDGQNRSRDTPPPMQRLRVEPAVAEATAAHMPSPLGAPIPVHLWPVAALDWTLGKSFGLFFGKPGRWFGQGSGKVLVGWCGVLMLCGAIAWGCVDYFGLSW